MVERSGLTPVVYVILRRGNSVLLQLRQGTGYLDGYWSNAAAGHVEARESVGDAASREAFEELGIVVAAKELIPVTAMHRSERTSLAFDDRIDFFFACKSWAGEPQIAEPAKSAGLAWFDLDDLPQMLVPHERYVLEHLRTGLPPIVAYGFSGPTTGQQ